MQSDMSDMKGGKSNDSCNVLPIEDAECLLQRLDLLLAACNTVLVADTSVHTGWLQLLVVRQCGIKLLLRAIKVSLLLLKSLLLVLLLARLVLDVLRLLCLVHRGISHELIILLLCLSLCCTGLGLQACKVGLDHFDHANHTAILGAHALVG